MPRVSSLLMLIMIVFAAAAAAAPAEQTKQFIQNSDGQCITNAISYLTVLPLINARQCAIACSTNSNCSAYVADVTNSTCKLYSQINMSNYKSLKFQSPNKCVIGVVNQQAEYIVCLKSTNWTVPSNIYAITGLCIGGGAGGGLDGHIGGGGSGYIAYSTMTVTPGTSIAITIGQGGAAGTSGSSSSIGSYVVANGGSSTSNNDGGAGGSGGGAGANGWGNAGGAGGTCGSKGVDGTASVGGTGQGTAVWLAAFAAINTTGLTVTAGEGGTAVSTNTAGEGGTAVSTDSNIAPGGGGGGGILVNGYGPTAGSGFSSVSGGEGGIGYGAGGGGAGCTSVCTFNGRFGVSGICIIKLL